MHMPPLTWTVDTKGLSNAPVSLSYMASSPELTGLAQYLDAKEVSSFTANVRIEPISGGKYKAAGKFSASLTQTSVVNLEPVDNRIEESFSLEYWPAELIPSENAEALSADEDLPEAIENGRIPIGRLLCELLALAVNPYPRNEGETFDWLPPGDKESEPGPFAELGRLKHLKRSDGG